MLVKSFGLEGAGDPNGSTFDGSMFLIWKRSFSQSKRGLRKASGGLGLRPLSNQGKALLHWLIRQIRLWRKMTSVFLFLQEKRKDLSLIHK